MQLRERNVDKFGARRRERFDFNHVLPPGVGHVRVVRQLAAVSGLGCDAVETRDVLGIGTVEAFVVTRFGEPGPKRFFVAGLANDAGDDCRPVRVVYVHSLAQKFMSLIEQR